MPRKKKKTDITADMETMEVKVIMTPRSPQWEARMVRCRRRIRRLEEAKVKGIPKINDKMTLEELTKVFHELIALQRKHGI